LNLGALVVLNHVLAQSLTDATTSAQIKSSGLSGTYSILPDPASSSPIVLVSSQAASQRVALAIVNDLLAMIPRRLSALQQAAGVTSSSSYVGSTVLSPALATAAVRSKRNEAVAAAVGGGLALTTVLILLAALIERRARDEAATA
jgi:hypothetical protein